MSAEGSDSPKGGCGGGVSGGAPESKGVCDPEKDDSLGLAADTSQIPGFDSFGILKCNGVKYVRSRPEIT